MVERILEVTPFQKERLTQLEDSLMNVNNVERTLAFTGMSVLFVGGEDDEKQIDRETLGGVIGGIFGLIRELTHEYVEDPITGLLLKDAEGKDIRIKNEEMVKVTGEILAINRIFKNQ